MMTYSPVLCVRIMSLLREYTQTLSWSEHDTGFGRTENTFHMTPAMLSGCVNECVTMGCGQCAS